MTVLSFSNFQICCYWKQFTVLCSVREKFESILGKVNLDNILGHPTFRNVRFYFFYIVVIGKGFELSEVRGT